MKRIVLGPAIVLSALAAWGQPAVAENPRVSLKLENATPAEAIARLSTASGVKLDLYSSGGGAPALTERASFDWTNVPLSKAMRELCGKFQLRPNRRPGGFTFYPSVAAPPAAAPKRVGLTEKGGMHFFARAVSVDERRALNFTGDNPDPGAGSLTLQIGAELGEGDAESLLGLENVRAEDDLGNKLVSNQGRSYYSGYHSNTFPDEWSGGASLSAPHPKAKKLRWVEADLMGYRSIRPVRIEIPLPLTGRSVRKQVGDWLVVVSQYRARQDDPEPDDDEGLPQIGGGAQAAGPSMRVRVYYPHQTRLVSRTGWGITPVLEGSSGRVYHPQMTNGSGTGDGQLMLSDYRLTYPALTDQPARLVWDLAERMDPVKLLTFRLGEIPLPQPQAFVPAREAPPVAPGAPTAPVDRPFYEHGGGTLVSSVRIGDAPAGAGSLQLGLAEKRGAAWGPVRWMDVEVDAQGVARLPDVKPGAYRVQRVSRAAVAAGGKWSGAEAVVTVVRGKELTLPPLRWTAAGTKPAPAPPPRKP